MKRAAEHVCAVIKGMLFIGFSVQIILGLLWMCRNLRQVQESGWEDFVLYRSLFRLLGEQPLLMYLLQLAAAFFAGYYFLKESVGRGFLVWCGLALVTFPFAMQCHLAVLPYSLMGSLFLLMLSGLRGLLQKGRMLRSLEMAAGCAVLMLLLSGAVDRRPEGEPGRCFEAVMADRAAWPTLWVDYEKWPEELQEITADVTWEASFYPGGMKKLAAVIEERAGKEKAREYYRQIAKTGWKYHAPMLMRQIGWDVLGYGVTPLIFRLQMEGEGYDSFSGRNYEAMRRNAPALTGRYVEYGCWWFGCHLVLTGILAAVRCFLEGGVKRKAIVFAVICIFISGILIGILTMRGAGVMDYRYTTAVNELWLILAFFTMGGKRRDEKETRKRDEVTA